MGLIVSSGSKVARSPNKNYLNGVKDMFPRIFDRKYAVTVEMEEKSSL